MSNKNQITNKAAKATALHVKNGDNHFVGIGNLKVIIVQDDSTWFAQGLEIDYAAEGESLEKVKAAFETGFCLTIHEHLRVYGSLEKFLIPAPVDIWKEMLYDQCSNLNGFSQISLHDLSEKVATHLPFKGIEYIQREKVAA